MSFCKKTNVVDKVVIHRSVRSTVMAWILENKDWLFSGAAIALPLAIIGWIFSSRKNRQVQKGGDNSTNIQVGGSFKIGDSKDDE